MTKQRLQQHLWILLVLCYLLVSVLFPISLKIDPDSCQNGTTQIDYVIRNRSLLPYNGPSDAELEKHTENGWVQIMDPRIDMDVGHTFGGFGKEQGVCVSSEPLEAGSYRLTVSCNYRLLGKIEKTVEFVID